MNENDLCFCPATTLAREVAARRISPVEIVDAVIARAGEAFGRLDVLINNAGGTPSYDTATASPRLHRSIVDLNLLFEDPDGIRVEANFVPGAGHLGPDGRIGGGHGPADDMSRDGNTGPGSGL